MSEQQCCDCARAGVAVPEQRVRYCPADGQYRCAAHRTAHLARLGVGRPVPQPPASVGQQGSFL